MATGLGPRGIHRSRDTYNTDLPQAPTGPSGFLITPPKQINAGDKKTGSPKTAAGRINPDTFNE
jgi:hypothetical protein